MGLKENLENRTWLTERLKAEIVGPDPALNGISIDTSRPEISLTFEEFRSAKIQKNGDEILWQDSPVKRYGAGILFPLEITPEKQLAEEANSVTLEPIEDNEVSADGVLDELENKVDKTLNKSGSGLEDSENLDVTLANSFRPSAMGLSFLANLSSENDVIIFRVSFAQYIKKKVIISDSEKSVRYLWIRKEAISDSGNFIDVEIPFKDVIEKFGSVKKWIPGFDKKLELVLVSRFSNQGNDKRIVTVSIVNRQTRGGGNIDEHCFFQTGIQIFNKDSTLWIEPYPQKFMEKRKFDDEEEINRLLYRDRLTFAIGHGCSAGWDGERPEKVRKIRTELVPIFETPSVSADLVDLKTGESLRVSMRKLAGLDPLDDGGQELVSLVSAYKSWIEDLGELDERKTYYGKHLPVEDDLKLTANLLKSRCEICLKRIQEGIDFLNSNSEEGRNAKEAFRLANEAMLIAQLRSSRVIRKPIWEKGKPSPVWDISIQNPDPSVPHEFKGYWRPFQIAFLLMSIKGVSTESSNDREIVDLIWFPTGGGKTEAYLGVTAYTIFYNRLSGKNSGGADVLMRYTLRLLTAQQFQRAGLLFCAMEFLRRKKENNRLEGAPFRLGMWVGGDTSPNTRADAKSALTKLSKNPDAANPFVLLKCPWCHAKFGPRERDDKGTSPVYGYKKLKPSGFPETVAFRCDDSNCEFGENVIAGKFAPLPISVIDEDILDNPPNMIIGTVDKFAMLAWKPEARSFFGIGIDGKHIGKPPTLIIQDELHLISGPLGSMVGAYETVIEELCTDYSGSKKLLPKIIASTATISRAEEQVKCLYAREKVMLFPPSGLEASDSFFARESRTDDGELKPGRMYLGVMCPGHGSLQTTQARVYASLLQYPVVMNTKKEDLLERDPWWTLLVFFNSIRELGGAASLLVADTRDYLRVILNRHGYKYSDIRQLLNVIELTSRIRSDHIPMAIGQLEKSLSKNSKGYFEDAVEVCLASNIIEVGVDIDRLSLMGIVGQPKTTSQYIQVSGRVGRDVNKPGLDVVMFSQSKPRDRSHYENFRSYHQKIYAHVEPTSVTPFSPPAVDRSLHGIIVAAVRQLSDLSIANNPRPFPLAEGTKMRQRIEHMIKSRVSLVDNEELENVIKVMNLRLREWETWNPSTYGGFGAQTENPPLMHPAGSKVPDNWHDHSWSVMSSLRNVDSNCEAEVTGEFNEVMEEG